ncbi:hypothetical protein BJX70DRAFT_401620 [Aspergillus crustosus]
MAKPDDLEDRNVAVDYSYILRFQPPYETIDSVIRAIPDLREKQSQVKTSTLKSCWSRLVSHLTGAELQQGEERVNKPPRFAIDDLSPRAIEDVFQFRWRGEYPSPRTRAYLSLNCNPSSSTSNHESETEAIEPVSGGLSGHSPRVWVRDQYFNVVFTVGGQRIVFEGWADNCLYYGKPGGLETNFVFVETERRGISMGVFRLLAYMDMIRRLREVHGKQKGTIYGLSTDAVDFYFSCLRPDGYYATRRLYSGQSITENQVIKEHLEGILVEADGLSATATRCGFWNWKLERWWTRMTESISRVLQ